ERNRLLMIWINLHDRAWFASHIFWLILKLIGATVSLNGAYWRSFLQAVSCIREVRVERRKEKKAALRSDRDIDSVFRALTANNRIYVLSNVKDYSRYLSLKQGIERQSNFD